MTNLFAYGSLMFDDVWQPLLGSEHRKSPAVLPGYVRFTVSGESYPGIRPDPSHSVAGVVIYNVTKQQLKQLDHFEGAYYQRISVPVILSNDQMLECNTYVFKADYYHLLSNQAWSADEFQQQHLASFLSQYPP